MKSSLHSLSSIRSLALANVALASLLLKPPSDVAALSESSFARGLHASVHALWGGMFDLVGFMDAMFALIEVEYTNAWHEGMRDAGVDPREMSIDEQTALQSHIIGAQGHAYDFGVYVEEHKKEVGDKLGSLEGRTELWLTGYNTVYNEALTFAASDPHLVWVLGATEKHCGSCSRLDGKIKRASQWDASMIQPSNPPNPYLECGGWRCECYFEVTNQNATRGRLPRLTMAVHEGG